VADGAGAELNEVVRFEVKGAIALITLDRPDQRNCINAEVADALRAAIRRLEADPSLRVGVLCGNGRVFCAGMDLKALSEGKVEEVLFGEGRFAGIVSLERRKPLIAAVQGAALAGGLEIMLSCDMVVAEEGTRFGIPEARIGLVAAAGGVFRLAQRIPPARARELVLTGAPFTTDEALAWGLLNRVVPEGEVRAAALALAGEVLKSAPESVTEGLRLARLLELEAEQRAWPVSDDIIRRLMVSADAMEGARAFIEKRPPVWAAPGDCAD